jgi:hypothetical protein
MASAIGAALLSVLAAALFDLLPGSGRYETQVVPDFKSPSLQITLSAGFQFNLIIIFYIAFSILFKKIRKKK